MIWRNINFSTNDDLYPEGGCPSIILLNFVVADFGRVGSGAGD